MRAAIKNMLEFSQFSSNTFELLSTKMADHTSCIKMKAIQACSKIARKAKTGKKEKNG